MSIRFMEAVFEHSRADGTLLVIGLALGDWCGEDGFCHPSYRQLAKKARCTRRTAIRGLQQLVTMGEWTPQPVPHLETENVGRLAFLRGQRTNSYRCTLLDKVVSSASPLRRGKVVSPMSPPRRQSFPQVVTSAPPEVVTPEVVSRSVSTDPSVQEKSSGEAPRAHPVENPPETATYGRLVAYVRTQLMAELFSSVPTLTQAVARRVEGDGLAWSAVTLSRAVAKVLVEDGVLRRLYPATSDVATHQQLVKLTHVLLDEDPALGESLSCLSFDLKDRCGRLGMTLPDVASREVQKAIDSALAQRARLTRRAR